MAELKAKPAEPKKVKLIFTQPFQGHLNGEDVLATKFDVAKETPIVVSAAVAKWIRKFKVCYDA